uniref:UBX domain-containing protein n=1 Tax=Ditylenchus dipsaci TaxID=166011 RepID=A0A915E454_9BILA
MWQIYGDNRLQRSSRGQAMPESMRKPSGERFYKKNGAVKNGDVSTVDLSDDEMERPVSNGVHQEDTVRTPILPVQGAIVQQSFQETYGRNTRRGRTSHVFKQFNDFRQVAGNQDAELLARTRNGNKQHNAQLEVEEIYSQQGPFVQQGDKEVQVVKTSNLSTLFRPPIDLIYQGNWENALLEAKRRGIWLLVNIQKADEFACQVLNRDVWSAPIVKEVISSNFLLWQVYHDSSHGARIRAYYSIRDYPAIFIVDPRIGEEVEKLRATDAVSFLDQVTAFLEKYPKSCAEEPQPSTSCSPSSSKRNNKRKADSMQTGSEDEEEEDEKDETTANFQAKRMRKVVNINDDEDGEDKVRQQKIGSSPLNINQGVDTDQWKSLVGEASNQDSKPVKLLMRMADGQKESISVLNTTKLKALFTFIAGRQCNPQEHWLVLNFPKRVFSVEEQDKNLEDAGFTEQEVVHVEKA